jgi:hypothetical protein
MSAASRYDVGMEIQVIGSSVLFAAIAAFLLATLARKRNAPVPLKARRAP